MSFIMSFCNKCVSDVLLLFCLFLNSFGYIKSSSVYVKYQEAISNNKNQFPISWVSKLSLLSSFSEALVL